jgi:hypothetical protein
MNAILCTAVLLVVTQPAPTFKDRERHPLAPSLPRLTKEEEQKIETIIERMIQADIGKLKAGDAKKALDDFNRLGPEASFNLIDGLNRAANMESSCPAVVIAKRLATILNKTDDLELLQFARENIGADVTAKRHLNVLKDLQTTILLRRGTLQRRALAQKDKGGEKAVASMSFAELEKALGTSSGTQLKAILIEAEKRQGGKAADLLLMGLAKSDAEVGKLSKDLLAKNLQRQTPDVLKSLLKYDQREARIAALQAIGARKLRHGAEVIALLQDSDAEVLQAARRALVQISGGVDHGPGPEAGSSERDLAVMRWREWWSKQK